MPLLHSFHLFCSFKYDDISFERGLEHNSLNSPWLALCKWVHFTLFFCNSTPRNSPPAEPHCNTNTHRTRAIQHMIQIHNKSQAPEDGCTNIRNMMSSKYWNNKASDIKLVYLYSNIRPSSINDLKLGHKNILKCLEIMSENIKQFMLFKYFVLIKYLYFYLVAFCVHNNRFKVPKFRHFYKEIKFYWCH